MKKIFTKEVIIGTCVVCAIVILVVGIEFLKGINLFKPANFYIAEYQNVAGLETAAPVTIDGYKVGQVREINFNYEKPGTVEVVLALNKNLHIPVDSKAIIGSTILSGSFIEIKLGTSDDMLEVGGNIPTASSSDLMTNINDNVLPAITGVIPKVDSLLISLNTLASDPALLASLQNMERITNNVEAASLSLKSVMSNNVPALLNKVPGILNNIDGVTQNLDSISYDLKVLSNELKALPLATTMDNVNEITSNLMKFSDKLNERNSTLGLLMNDTQVYDNLTRVTADIDSLIVDIKKNPKRYISIKLL